MLKNRVSFNLFWYFSLIITVDSISVIQLCIFNYFYQLFLIDITLFKEIHEELFFLNKNCLKMTNKRNTESSQILASHNHRFFQRKFFVFKSANNFSKLKNKLQIQLFHVLIFLLYLQIKQQQNQSIRHTNHATQYLLMCYLHQNTSCSKTSFTTPTLATHPPTNFTFTFTPSIPSMLSCLFHNSLI